MISMFQLKKGSKRYLYFKVTEEDGGTISITSATATIKDYKRNTLATPTPTILDNDTVAPKVVVMFDTTQSYILPDNYYYLAVYVTIGAEIFVEEERIDVVQ